MTERNVMLKQRPQTSISDILVYGRLPKEVGPVTPPLVAGSFDARTGAVTLSEGLVAAARKQGQEAAGEVGGKQRIQVVLDQLSDDVRELLEARRAN